MTSTGYGVLDPLAEWPEGVKALRLWDCGVAWSNLNPAPGVFDFSLLERIISAHPRADYTLVLSGTPQWAASDPNQAGAAPWVGPASNSPPARMGDWEEFCKQVTLAFRGRIRQYQVWNEPQLKEFWSPYGQVAKLGQMTATARRVIRRIDPEARIVSAPMLPRPSSGGMRRAAAYLRALKGNGWPVDAFALHVYPEKGTSAARWRDLVVMGQQGLVREDAPLRPLWVTETNYNLMGGPLSPSIAARRVKATQQYAARLGVKRLYWYAYGTHSNPQVLGIPFTEGSAGAKAVRPYL